MLVLSRKLNEELVIDGNIRIKVIAIEGNRVRFGIEAPARVSVVREELQSAVPSNPPINRRRFAMSLVE